MRTLHWFREDLWLVDNTALYHAGNQAEKGCLAIYIITPQAWQEHAVAACRVDFTLRGLATIQTSLAKLNIPLLVKSVARYSDIPDLLLTVCRQYQIDKVHFNKQYEVNELIRDEAVITLLKSNAIQVQAHHDQTIIEPQLILSKNHTPFTIYSFYKKSWLKHYEMYPVALLPAPRCQLQPVFLQEKTEIPRKIIGFDNLIHADYWLAGENAAEKRLHHFINNILTHYKTWRDFPAIDGTSKLSPYLACGMISARQCLAAALKFNEGNLTSGNEGAVQWISELIWREFYKMILVYFPRVSRHKAFKLATEKIQWHNNEDYFSAWKKGQTGFPLVDAAMRQLHEMGWMHNRLRMIVAMFLSKQLWIDWRWGEKFFMQNLIDGDLSANNGGWQWSASTGNDAVPYFRIFNPITQSQRFDPEGKFIRQYCPELRHLNNEQIHQPYGKPTAVKLNYPKPIIDYKSTRVHAIAAFKDLR